MVTRPGSSRTATIGGAALFASLAITCSIASANAPADEIVFAADGQYDLQADLNEVAEMSADYGSVAFDFAVPNDTAEEPLDMVELTASFAAEDAGMMADTYDPAAGCYDPCSNCQCNGCRCSGAQKSVSLMGCFKSTPGGFDRFVSPMTNPVFFEDPRTLTEARFFFLNHKVPSAAGGGDIQVYALQIRAAITERLSLIATKDGYAVSSNPLIRDGWADIAAGLKYTLFSDVRNQRLLSVGAAYELPTGSLRTLQGNGDGEFHLFMSGGTQLCCRGHWITATGFRLPSNPWEESRNWYWSNHFDYEVCRGWYAVSEVNWFHCLDSGGVGLAGVDGGDLFNFGSTGVDGHSIVTGAFGTKFKPSAMSEIGVAWEFPLTDRRDVIENRLTVDVIRRF